MMPAASPRVLFRAAAGPRIGFGHLVRCRSLVRALGAVPVVSVRGSRRAKAVAASMGWTLADGSARDVLGRTRPDLTVVDDPSSVRARAWVLAARAAAVPVAVVSDLGHGGAGGDIAIDGSAGALPLVPDEPAGPAASPAPPALLGLQYAILDPAVLRHRDLRRTPEPRRILVALGGGAHVYSVAGALARALARRAPTAEVRVARGFAPPQRVPRLAGATWVLAPDGLAAELASAAVAVVAGGVTLIEACAIGVPAVAVAVVPAQRISIAAMARRHAATDGGGPPLDDGAIERVADLAVGLLADEATKRRQAEAGLRLVDARGAFRVADRLRRLARPRGNGEGPANAGRRDDAA